MDAKERLNKYVLQLNLRKFALQDTGYERRRTRMKEDFARKIFPKNGFLFEPSIEQTLAKTTPVHLY